MYSQFSYFLPTWLSSVVMDRENCLLLPRDVAAVAAEWMDGSAILKRNPIKPLLMRIYIMANFLYTQSKDNLLRYTIIDQRGLTDKYARWWSLLGDSASADKVDICECHCDGRSETSPVFKLIPCGLGLITGDRRKWKCFCNKYLLLHWRSLTIRVIYPGGFENHIFVR